MVTPVDRSVRENRSAWFTQLYQAHAAAVARRLRALGVQDATIEDAVQDVFVIAFRRGHTYEARASWRSWLLGVARRIAARYRRGRARAARRHTALAVVVEAHATADAPAHAERRCDLEQMLAALDPDRRSALLLGDVEGRTREELGVALGVRPTTAYSRLVSARRAATAWLGDRSSVDAPEHEGRRGKRKLWAGAALPWRSLWAPRATMVLIGFAALLVVAPAPLPTGLPVPSASEGGSSPGGSVGRAVIARAPELDPVFAASPPGSMEAEAPDPGSDRAQDAWVAPAEAYRQRRARSSRAAPSPRPADALPSPRRTTSKVTAPHAESPRNDHPKPHGGAGTAADAPSDLHVELDLLMRARTALRERRLDDTRALLDDHARRFPDSTLRRERARTRAALGRRQGSSIPAKVGTGAL